MNCSKIFPPSSILLELYYYYSNLILLLSLFVTPLEVYIILTKSKNLGSYKWLLLNQTFWSFLLELILTSVKPVVLIPAIAAYPTGLFQTWDLTSLLYGTFGAAIVLVINGGAYMSTALYRYLNTFPSWASRFFTIRCNTIYCIISISFIFGVMIYIYNTVEKIDIVKMRQAAIESDPCMAELNMPGFLFVAYRDIIYPLELAFLWNLFCFLGTISLAFYFIFLVKTHQTATVSKLQISLILSAIVQLSITSLVLVLPLVGFFGIVFFQIGGSVNFGILGACYFLSHHLLESTASLLFVPPYRKAILEILGKVFPFLRYHNKTKVVSIVPTTRMPSI